MLKRNDLQKVARILGGLLVGRAAPRGDAARAGVREGDIVLSVNGVPTADVATFVRARRLRSDGATFELFRFGQRLRIEVTHSEPQGTNSEGRAASQEPNSGSRAAYPRAYSASAASS